MGSTLRREQERGSAIGGSVLGTWAYVTTGLQPLQPALTPVTTALVSEEELEKADKEGRQIIAGPLAPPDPKDLSPGEEIVPPTWVIDDNERPFKAFSVPPVRPTAPPKGRVPWLKDRQQWFSV